MPGVVATWSTVPSVGEVVVLEDGAAALELADVALDVFGPEPDRDVADLRPHRAVREQVLAGRAVRS
jgi:hypothetical protein